MPCCLRVSCGWTDPCDIVDSQNKEGNRYVSKVPENIRSVGKVPEKVSVPVKNTDGFSYKKRDDVARVPCLYTLRQLKMICHWNLTKFLFLNKGSRSVYLCVCFILQGPQGARGDAGIPGKPGPKGLQAQPVCICHYSNIVITTTIIIIDFCDYTIVDLIRCF
jgi:hypothetical protein